MRTIYIIVFAGLLVGIPAMFGRRLATLALWKKFMASWMLRNSVSPIALEPGKVYVFLYDENRVTAQVIYGLSEFLESAGISGVYVATTTHGEIVSIHVLKEDLVSALAMLEAREEAARS